MNQAPGVQAVRRTFRRILSGDDEGRPPWVRAIGEPGDAGWFGPGSAIWEVHGSLATLVGGIRALLLQSTHPLALAGVEQHSSYRQDPLGRLHRTNMFVTTTTFGSGERALAMTEMVRRVHERVVGTAADGRTYAASDPDLLLWVHLALTDSMLVAAQAFHPRHVDADAYVKDMAVIGRRVGVDVAPETETELHDALSGYVPQLEGGPAARDVARFLQRPPLPAAAVPPYLVLARAATDLLPDWAHPLLATPVRSPAMRVADRLACRSMLDVLRVVLGDQSPVVDATYERLGITR
jgi:uncharacterized protein (DUF2236 family)